MKTLIVAFVFVASSSGVLPQTKRIGDFQFAETKLERITRSVFKTTNSTHSQTSFASSFSFGAGKQVGRKQALSKAVQEKDLAAVKALLARGADPNVSGEGGPPLTWAARLNLTDIVKLLLESGADVNARNNDGQSILISAAEWPFGERNGSYVPTIRALLDKGADVSTRDRFNMTALLYAAYYRDANVVRLLLDWRSDINAKSNGGETALILVSPEEIGFYGLLLFYLIHFPGAILVSLFSKHNVVEGSRYSHYSIGFVLITVNATLVFLISWIARMRVRPDNA